MRRFSAGLALIAAAPMIFGSATAASAAPVSQTIRVRAVLGPNQANRHNIFFTDRLYQGDRQVGHDAFTCRQTRLQVRCTGVVIFPAAGDIFVQATVKKPVPQNITMTILGGTRRFFSARGTVLLQGNSAKIAHYVIHYRT